MKPIGRAFVVGTALLIPAVYSFKSVQNENPAIVKAVETEREDLQKKEGEFASKLRDWAQFLDDKFVPDTQEELQLRKATGEFSYTTEGPPPENFIDKINGIVGINVIPRIPRRPRNDFWVQPSQDQVKAFIKLINAADKVAPVTEPLLAKDPFFEEYKKTFALEKSGLIQTIETLDLLRKSAL